MANSSLAVFAGATPTWKKLLTAAIPFVALLAVYLIASDTRLTENPHDKLLPSFTQMVNAIDRVAFTPDRRSGDYLFWKDTLSSLKRLLTGVSLAAITALLLGLNMGVYRRAESMGVPFVTTLSMIPPLAILPVLFIAFGVGEVGKIALIFLGTFPLFARDVYLNVRSIPKEQVVKAMTLGASNTAVAYKIVLPQVMPKLLQSVRLGLGAAWLFLIAAEAIASTDGLGYRIFLVRRYMSMDVILPYVAWITFLGYMLDLLLRKLTARIYPWYVDK